MVEDFERDAEHGWVFGRVEGMSAQCQEDLKAMVLEAQGGQCIQFGDLPGYCGDMPKFGMPLSHDRPIWCPARKLSVLEKEVQDEKCGELRDHGIISPSTSTKYASGVVIAAKKDAVTGEWTDKRFCVDMRAQNLACADTDRYQLPLIDELFDRIGDASVFSHCDLRSGFYQLEIAEEHRPHSSFWWNGQLWMFNRVVMGAKNAPAYFQRVVDYELAKAGCSSFAVAFVDDVLIFSKTPEEHVKHVGQVLAALQNAGLRIHPSKSVFGTGVCEFLGHDVSKYGISPTKAKVAAIEALRPPRNVGELRSLLGLMSYYRSYLPNFSAISQPLNALLKKGSTRQWTPACQAAFEALKAGLTMEGNCLRRVRPDKPLVLYTDLEQGRHRGRAWPRWRRQRKGAGSAYVRASVGPSTSTSVITLPFKGKCSQPSGRSVELRHYLHGRKFTLVTDHEPLKWLMHKPELTGQHARWAMMLTEFDFTLEHRPGVSHVNADILSRQPLPIVADFTGARLDGVWGTEGTTHQVGAQLAVECLSAACADREGFMDSLAYPPLHQESGLWAAVGIATPDEAWEDDQTAAQQQELRARACSAYKAAGSQLDRQQEQPAQPLRLKSSKQGWRCRHVEGLATQCIGQQFFANALQRGVTLFEPFGGMCAGLEMCLRNGIKVLRYLYVDKDPVAQAVAAGRLARLSQQYPSLFSPAAYRHAFALPQQVQKVTADKLVAAGARDRTQWLVVAGWECQDLSTAGRCQGLEGPRSSTFYDLLRLVGTLQQLQPTCPPGYLLENVAMQHNYRSAVISKEQYQLVCHAIREPVCLDAAQVGAYAHRLRNFWSNLAPARQLEVLLQHMTGPSERRVQDILDPGRRAQPAIKGDRHPFYPVNVKGQPLKSLPTLVAYGGVQGLQGTEAGVCVRRGARQMGGTQPGREGKGPRVPHGDHTCSRGVRAAASCSDRP
jgi:hypothetical protein